MGSDIPLSLIPSAQSLKLAGSRRASGPEGILHTIKSPCLGNIKESDMAEKKAILVLADALDLNASGEALDALRKKAALLPCADCAGLAELAEKLGAVKTDTSGIQAALDGARGDSVLVMAEGDALAAALEAADRRTLVVVATGKGAAFYGMAINSKAGTVERAVNAQDMAVTIATIADLPVDESCTGAIIYQVMKNPNLKLDEIRKLKEALVRMESVIQRDNREPWDKHDCA